MPATTKSDLPHRFFKDFTHGENYHISTSFLGDEIDYFHGKPTCQNTSSTVFPDISEAFDYGLWSMEDYGALTSPSITAHNVSSDMSVLS